jgi:hypothetical protein
MKYCKYCKLYKGEIISQSHEDLPKGKIKSYGECSICNATYTAISKEQTLDIYKNWKEVKQNEIS